MKRSKTVLLTALFAIFIVVIGYAYYLNRGFKKISEAPSRRSLEYREFNVKTSSIGVNIRLYYDKLMQRANQKLPRHYSDDKIGPDRCKKILGANVCAGTKYSYQASRGDVSILPGNNNTIHIAVPISMTGHVGFRGKAAHLLRLDDRPMRASVNVYTDVGFKMNPDWCPKPEIKTGFEWIDGAQLKIFGTWVGISHLLENSLRSQMDDLGKDLLSGIDCEAIKRQAENIWMTYSVRQKTRMANKALYLNITPKDFAFSGMTVEPQFANLALKLTANMQITTRPGKTHKLALPQLGSDLVADNTIRLAVPLVLPYDRIRILLQKNLLQKPISSDTPAGEIELITKQVSVYPSDENLVVGLLLHIKMPHKLLDVNGWVYLKTKPKVITDGTAVILDEVEFSQVTNSALWDLISAIMNDTILMEVKKQGVFELKSAISKAKKSMLKQIEKPYHGFEVELIRPNIKLGRMSVLSDGLYIEGLFSSNANVNLANP